MSRSPRAEALHLTKTEATIEPPKLPEHLVPNTPEALAYLDSFKEEHFVALAHVTDLLLATALERRRPDNSLRPPTESSQYRQRGRWHRLAESWRDDLWEAEESIRATEEYVTAARFAEVTGTLNTRRHLHLNTKLRAGSGTAIVSNLTILRNLPHITRHHAGETSDLELAAMARHPGSTSLVRRLAKQSVNQFMAAQAVLEGRDQFDSWQSLDHVLQPEHFSLQRYTDGSASLSYADFDELTVPKGYKPHDPFQPVEQETLIKDVPSEQSKTIGCPVTLLQGRMNDVWQWGVDLVEANDLWDESRYWPPTA